MPPFVRDKKATRPAIYPMTVVAMSTVPAFFFAHCRPACVKKKNNRETVSTGSAPYVHLYWLWLFAVTNCGAGCSGLERFTHQRWHAGAIVASCRPLKVILCTEFNQRGHREERICSRCYGNVRWKKKGISDMFCPRRTFFLISLDISRAAEPEPLDGGIGQSVVEPTVWVGQLG